MKNFWEYQENSNPSFFRDFIMGEKGYFVESYDLLECGANIHSIPLLRRE